MQLKLSHWGPLHRIDAIIPPAHKASPPRVGLSSVHHEIGRKGTVIKVRRIHEPGLVGTLAQPGID